MKTVAAGEGHPVVHIAAVILTHQIGIGGFGIDAINTGGSVPTGTHHTGYQIGGAQTLAVFVEPKVLSGEVDFNIGATVGHVPDTAGQVGNGTVTGDAFFHAGDDVLGDGSRIQRKTLIGDGHVQSSAAGGPERTGGAFNAVFFA